MIWSKDGSFERIVRVRKGKELPITDFDLIPNIAEDYRNVAMEGRELEFGCYRESLNLFRSSRWSYIRREAITSLFTGNPSET